MKATKIQWIVEQCDSIEKRLVQCIITITVCYSFVLANVVNNFVDYFLQFNFINFRCNWILVRKSTFVLKLHR